MKVISLFSGAGFMDLGFIKQGFEIIWANDFEKAACDTYAKNIGNHILHKNILEIDSKDIPDCDGVIGGSPCQAFSNANRHDNFLDNPKNFLVREFIRVVQDKSPYFFVLENVPQILTAGNGKFAQEIINKLCDYHIEVRIMNAIDYGSAQKRRRAIFIGVKNGIIEHPEITTKIHKNISEAFEGLNDTIPNQKDFSKSSELVKERMSYIRQGNNWEDIPQEIRGNMRKGRTHSSLYKRLSYSEPSITITNFRKSLITHPTENRILSIREAARIQGIPDEFIFYGTMSEKQQMVANGVPVELSEAIAKEIKNSINSINTQTQKCDIMNYHGLQEVKRWVENLM